MTNHFHIYATGTCPFCIEAIKMNCFKKAIAFEPAIRNFRLLKANIFLNELESRIKVYNFISHNKVVIW